MVSNENNIKKLITIQTLFIKTNGGSNRALNANNTNFHLAYSGFRSCALWSWLPLGLWEGFVKNQSFSSPLESVPLSSSMPKILGFFSDCLLSWRIRRRCSTNGFRFLCCGGRGGIINTFSVVLRSHSSLMECDFIFI